ncbi:MAG: hypothetical protein FJX54_22210 [Alphaproteobacteria bacterium]|nr:hypothetical protein [Alphaproteobacteria bacterium]
MTDLHRGLGQAEGRIVALERNITEINDSLKMQGDRLGNIERMLAETKGGWKVLAAAGSIGAGLMALVIKLFPFIPIGR